MTTDYETDHGYTNEHTVSEPEVGDETRTISDRRNLSGASNLRGVEPQGPINWNLLGSEQAESEWLDLNAWLNWLRVAYGLPPTVIPPFWHRHDELVWELSALHQHWLNSYDPDGSPSAPLAWHRDLAEAKIRLREWVSTSGTRVDRDRPTRHTIWPGEAPDLVTAETVIVDRDADFVQFVIDDVTERRRIEDLVHSRAS